MTPLPTSLAVWCLWCMMRCSAVQGGASNDSMRAQDILMNILNGGMYDAKIPPNFNEEAPADVTVQLVVLSVDSVDESSMDYSMSVYLRQRWKDERLKFSSITHVSNASHESPGNLMVTETRDDITDKEKKKTEENTKKEHSHDRLELDTRIMEKVWFPDTYFINERSGAVHQVTVPNKLMHIFSDGQVFYSIRLSLTLTCLLGLSKYPFDRQSCPLTLASYGFTEKILRYKWFETQPIIVKNTVKLPTFTVDDWKPHECDKIFATDGYSCLQLTVTLTRVYGYYITQVYVPSVLVVILSWVNFWLDIEAVPARTSLGLLTVLTMTTMSADSLGDRNLARSPVPDGCNTEEKLRPYWCRNKSHGRVRKLCAKGNLPKVSYVKAIDLWMAVCLFFVFGALLEFSYINVTSRVQKRRLSMREAVKLATTAKAAEEGKQKKPSLRPKIGGTSNADRARRVDKISRLAFPLVFLLFNVFYWCFYMI